MLGAISPNLKAGKAGKTDLAVKIGQTSPSTVEKTWCMRGGFRLDKTAGKDVY
jgi:hypothetical protein